MNLYMSSEQTKAKQIPLRAHITISHLLLIFVEAHLAVEYIFVIV